MTQSELELAVAEATGEDVCDINQRGFSLIDGPIYDLERLHFDAPPRIVDWDSSILGATMTLVDVV
jgi:hypothetical protein